MVIWSPLNYLIYGHLVSFGLLCRNGSKAKKDKRKTVSSRRVKSSGKGDDDSDEKDTEGLAQLIPEINKTLQLVKTTVDRLLREKKG